MLSKIISIGNKIELTRVSQQASYNLDEEGIKKNKVYVSQVYEVIDDDHIKIAVPLDGGKVVMLPNNTRIDACFITSKGLYQGRFVIVDRYKEGNLVIQVIELINELQKYQRRQFFRLSCTMGIMYKILEDEETVKEYMEEEEELSEKLKKESLMQGVALDISGGGMRFVSKNRHNKYEMMAALVRLSYSEEEEWNYGILAKIISVSTSKNNKNLFEHRVEFLNVDSKVRENIIKFIFEEERKRRKKESGQ